MLKACLPFAIYLSFNGNCRQAFNYYHSCFGGELALQTLADTPHGAELDPQMQRTVVCATLQNNYCRLIGTDLTDEGRIVPGNNVSILIDCSSRLERISLLNKLTARNFCLAESTNPLIGITDQYRISWILRLS